MEIGFSPLAAVTYRSSASSGTTWTGTTTLDSYQNTSSSFKGSGSTMYNFDDGDTLQGFFMFKNGIDATGWQSGSLTWDGEGMIDGTLAIPTYSNLILNSSLHLGPNAQLGGTGQFYIDGTINNNKIILNGDKVALSRSMEIVNSLTIDGQGNIFTINSGGCFCDSEGLAAGLALINMDLIVNNVDSSIFQNNTSATLKNLRLLSSGAGSAITLSDGFANIVINGNVRLEGFGQRIKVGAGITINANSTLYVGPGVTLTNIASVTMADQTSVLHLDGCKLYTGNNVDNAALTSSLSLTKGTLLLDNKVQIYNKNYGDLAPANKDMTKGFFLGDGISSSNNVEVRVLGGAYVIVDGCMQFKHS